MNGILSFQVFERNSYGWPCLAEYVNVIVCKNGESIEMLLKWELRRLSRSRANKMYTSDRIFAFVWMKKANSICPVHTANAKVYTGNWVVDLEKAATRYTRAEIQYSAPEEYGVQRGGRRLNACHLLRHCVDMSIGQIIHSKVIQCYCAWRR